MPVTVTCRILKLSRQPYYRRLVEPITASEAVEAYRANALFNAHSDDPSGRPPPASKRRLLAEGTRDAGEAMADRTYVADLRGQRVVELVREETREETGKSQGPPVHDDLCTITDETGRVRHEFTAGKPNQLWLMDITEHKTAEGKLYLYAIKDVCSNRIVGYSIDPRMKSRLAVTALENAVARRGDMPGCVVHRDERIAISEPEVPACSHPPPHGRLDGKSRFLRRQRRDGILFSARRTRNVLDRRSWTTREQLRIAIVTWIERTYHRRRRQARLGRSTPVEFETIMNTPAALAA